MGATRCVSVAKFHRLALHSAVTLRGPVPLVWAAHSVRHTSPERQRPHFVKCTGDHAGDAAGAAPLALLTNSAVT